VIVACALGSARPDEPASAPARLRVLFIGNSLTASNDLPAIVQAMARLRGVELQYEACTPGGASLEDHWNDGHCRKLLGEQQWDYVVLQQGPSSREDSRANLKEWSTRWAHAIRERGARTALYMVWPQRGQQDGFQRVSESYRRAADASEALLLPAGLAWREIARQAPDVHAYGSDGLHPTAEGTYLAALVIANGVAGVRPDDVPAQLTPSAGARIDIDAHDAQALRAAARAVLQPSSQPVTR